MSATRLALGPVLYYWARERVLAFYAEAAEAPVDVVYLGEAVCVRRREMRLADWLATARRLAEAGKEVVLSSQALLESEADLRALRRLAEAGTFRIEANDMSAVGVLAGRAAFVAGPHLNVYNARTLALLARLGAARWVAPVEISRAQLEAIAADRPPGLEIELFAHGRLPLAFSARCFTARHYNLQKDECGFRCMDHPDGLPLHTADGDPFLVLNGIQTQSARVYALLDDLAAVARSGVDIVRISPQAQGTFDIVRAYRAALAPAAPARNPDAGAVAPAPGEACNGYWHGVAGLATIRPEGRIG
ncbi:MAG: U32 family peptidase [Burkholderiales bacterium]|nr:U32 family peptidase [Burkholderiales bacterium]